jgi:hypothetical protein
MTISESELLAFLRDIEEGRITLTTWKDPRDEWGDTEYSASNGWTITVFNDCGEWDYIDSVKTNDGRSIYFDDLSALTSIRNYYPLGDTAWTCYRMPGYKQYRE